MYYLHSHTHSDARACHFYNYSASGRARNLALDSLTLRVYIYMGACCTVGNNGGGRYFLWRDPLEIA